jgi:sulfur-oxidizing protein SoxY
VRRREFLAGVGGAIAVPLLPGAALAQAVSPVEAQLRALTGGATVTKGRVHLELPQLADNGNSVAMKVSVESPMTAADHVKAIYLYSDRNPVTHMASFHLGPRAGKAEVSSRVRLAGSQRVTAVAQMSDGSFWSDTAEVVVTLSACLDES